MKSPQKYEHNSNQEINKLNSHIWYSKLSLSNYHRFKLFYELSSFLYYKKMKYLENEKSHKLNIQ